MWLKNAQSISPKRDVLILAADAAWTTTHHGFGERLQFTFHTVDDTAVCEKMQALAATSEKAASMTPVPRTITVNTLQLHVMDWGGNGSPLLLVHGLASSLHMFDLIAPALTAHHHVYAIDMRGHGESDKPDSGYDFETISRDLDSAVRELGIHEPFTLIGHSWGAYTALYYAATRPKNVKKAVLLDGGTYPLREDFETWEVAEEKMAPPRYINRTEADIRYMIREQWLKPFFRPELEPLAASIFDMSDPSAVKARLSFNNHMQIARHIWEFTPADYYERVTCPTLIVVAAQPGEGVNPKREHHVQLAERKIEHAQVVWMHDTYHDIPWHRPAELTSILLGFLEQ